MRLVYWVPELLSKACPSCRGLETLGSGRAFDEPLGAESGTLSGSSVASILALIAFISETRCCCVAAIEAIMSMMEDVSAVVCWEVAPGKAPAEADDVPAEGPGNVPAESPVVEPAELSSTPTLG